MPGNALVVFLQATSVVVAAAMAAKLLKTHLYRRYRVLFWYFAFRAVNGVWPLFLHVKSDLYFYFWVFTLPINLLFYIWVVLELCGLVLERHRGLYTLGRWAMYFGMAVSITLSVLSLLPRITPATPQRSRIMFYFMATDRGVTFCMALFLILMLFLLSRYPVTLNRNVVLHATIYSVFFLSNTLDVILQSVFGVHLYMAIDTGLMGISCACLLTWLLFLNPRGEETRVQIPHFLPEHEERLLYQLDALNATMLKISRE